MPPVSSAISGSERAADDQLRERVRYLSIGLQVGLNGVLHRERHVRMPNPLAERIPVDLRVPPCGGVAQRGAKLKTGVATRVAMPGIAAT